MRSWLPARLVAELLEDRAQASATPLQPPINFPDWTALGTSALVGPVSVSLIPTATPTDPSAPVGRLTSMDVAPWGVSDVLAAPAPTAARHELVLIEADVPDADALAQSFLAAPAGTTTEVVQLHGGGAAEVAAVLRGYTGLDAVRLVSHGAAGGLDLGSEWLDARTAAADAAELAAWAAALKPGGDLLLYGCDVAATAAGRAFVTQLASLTGADVAASTDATGAAALGGNWALEYATGTIQAPAVNITGWHSTLGVVVTGDSFVVAADNTVYRLDALTGAVITTYSTGLANDGVAVGPDGTIYLADYYNDRIRYYSPSGALINDFSTNGNTPQGLAFGPDGNLYVTTTNNTVERYRPDGSNHTTFISAGSGGLSNGKGIVWGPDGNAYVSSYDNSEVLRYNGTTGAFVGVFATGSGGFEDLTFGPDGNLYVASYGDGTVYRYRGSDGAPLGAFATGISTAYGLRFDPNGSLVVSDRSDGRLMRFDGATGAYLGDLATGLPNPSFLATTTSLVTTSAGGTATFRVALTSQPATDVTVTLASSNPAQGSLSSTTLTFTPGNWNAPQVVTVTGLDDGIANGDQAYQITGTASGDAAYAGLTMAPVAVLNREVPPPNRPPVPNTDIYTTAEDTPLTVAAPGVLANDTDPDGNTLTVTGYTQPAHGTLTGTASGGFTYTPAANYNGPDSFTYTVSDGKGGTATGMVNLTVTPVNDPPVATDDSYSTAVNLLILSTPLSVSAPGVLANDTDIDGDALTAQLVSGPAHGAFSFNADGSFTYTAVLNFSGTDSFTYRAFDGTAYSAPATVSINVAATNQAPTATADTYTTAEDTPLNVAAAGVLGNDSDPDGDTISAVLDTGPAHGTLTFSANGSFTYTPVANYNGADSFTYHATDGSLDSAPVTVSLTVTAVNDAPTFALAGDPPAVAEDAGPQAVAGFATGISPGPPDEAGQTLTFVVTGDTNPGLFSAVPAIAPDGTLTYTPAPDASGTATITVVLRDDGGSANGGRDTSAALSFTVTVTPVNDPPTLDPVADVGLVIGRGAQTVTLTGISAGGGESQPLTVTATSSDPTVVPDPVVSYTSPNATGVLTIGPPGWTTGTATITVVVGDGVTTVTRQFTVTVTQPDPPPVGADDSYSLHGQQRARNIGRGRGVVKNDTDPDGDPITVVLQSGPANGAVLLNASGAFVYVAHPGFAGTDTFIYRATDPAGAVSGPVTVTMTVPAGSSSANADEVYTITAGQTLVVAGVADDPTDPSPFRAVLLTSTEYGTVTMSDDGSFSYTPDAGFTGTDTFSYELTDGVGSVTIRVAITVTPPPPAADTAPTAAPSPGATYTDPTSPTDPATPAQTNAEPSAGPTAGPATGSTAGPTAVPTTGSAAVPTAGSVAGPTAAPPAVGGATPAFASVALSATAAGGATTGTATDTRATDGTLRAIAVPLGGSDIGRVYAALGGPGDAPAVALAAPSAPALPPDRPAPPPEVKPAPPAVSVVPPPVTPGPAVSAPPVPAPEMVLPPAVPEGLTTDNPVFAALDETAGDLEADNRARATTDAVIVTGAAAAAGYVLLNTRAVYWLLTALLARPAVWRRFDPLDVIFAWEAEQKARGGRPAPGDDDSLQSMVG